MTNRRGQLSQFCVVLQPAVLCNPNTSAWVRLLPEAAGASDNYSGRWEVKPRHIRKMKHTPLTLAGQWSPSNIFKRKSQKKKTASDTLLSIQPSIKISLLITKRHTYMRMYLQSFCHLHYFFRLCVDVGRCTQLLKAPYVTECTVQSESKAVQLLAFFQISSFNL